MESKQMAFAASTGEEVAAGDNSKASFFFSAGHSEGNLKSLYSKLDLPNIAYLIHRFSYMFGKYVPTSYLDRVQNHMLNFVVLSCTCGISHIFLEKADTP